MARNRFSADLAAFAKKSKMTLDQVHRGIVIKLFSSVILDTPVLDGFLRGAWTLSHGAPDTSSKRVSDKSGGPTIAAVKGNPGNAGERTFLTNSMPYAYRVEYEGWSHTKAPHGMVRKNVARIQALIEEAVREARS